MFLAGMLAIWAAAGALAMKFGLVDLGPAIDCRLPLHSPVLGGVALGLIVEAPMAATALLTARGEQHALSR
ncbi:hypothetical protein ACQP2U_18905 [Nocardia sp. CA-084685]|uniref:hypothetical protein n=1 Tax=Nocardia sp. CA-084685 TaxID=3239970 RepID=UPI003D9754D9